MLPEAERHRAEQIATLEGLAHEKLCVSQEVETLLADWIGPPQARQPQGGTSQIALVAPRNLADCRAKSFRPRL